MKILKPRCHILYLTARVHWYTLLIFDVHSLCDVPATLVQGALILRTEGIHGRCRWPATENQPTDALFDILHESNDFNDIEVRYSIHHAQLIDKNLGKDMSRPNASLSERTYTEKLLLADTIT